MKKPALRWLFFVVKNAHRFAGRNLFGAVCTRFPMLSPEWATVDLGRRYSFTLKTGQAVTVRADLRNLFYALSIGAWLNSGAGLRVTLWAAIDFQRS